jgi:3-hydroxybutyryl-CoA dehydrogenase
MDLTGLPSYAAVMQRLFPALNYSTDVPKTMQTLVAAGAQGIPNGVGFYRYTPEQARHWEQKLRQRAWRALEECDSSKRE